MSSGISTVSQTAFITRPRGRDPVQIQSLEEASSGQGTKAPAVHELQREQPPEREAPRRGRRWLMALAAHYPSFDVQGQRDPGPTRAGRRCMKKNLAVIFPAKETAIKFTAR